MCLVLIVAIIYPIYGMVVLDVDIAIAPDYYHKVFLPLGIVSLAFASVSVSSNLIQGVVLLGLAFVMSLALLLYFKLHIYAGLFIIPSLWLFFASVLKYNRQRKMAGYQNSLKPLAVLLAHAGFAS